VTLEHDFTLSPKKEKWLRVIIIVFLVTPGFRATASKLWVFNLYLWGRPWSCPRDTIVDQGHLPPEVRDLKTHFVEQNALRLMDDGVPRLCLAGIFLWNTGHD